MKKTEAKTKSKAPKQTKTAGRRPSAPPAAVAKKSAKKSVAKPTQKAAKAAKKPVPPLPRRTGVPSTVKQALPIRERRASATAGASKVAETAVREGRASPRPAVSPVAQTAAASGGEGCYVYCIIRSREPLRFGPIGLGAQPSEVRTINYKDLAAVVSDTPLEVYDPTRENVLAHERVNDSVMRERTVLPMSFGTVFKTPQDIVELMRSAYDAFRDVLAKMEDKVEFGLKILWETDGVIRELERHDENLRRVKEEISSQRGSTYFARMQYGRLVDSLLQERSSQLVSEIFETLRGVAIASRSNKPIGDKMILNAAFLVARDSEAEFDARVKEIGARHEHLNIRYTGPWPPYNFVNVRLKLERATED